MNYHNSFKYSCIYLSCFYFTSFLFCKYLNSNPLPLITPSHLYPGFILNRFPAPAYLHSYKFILYILFILLFITLIGSSKSSLCANYIL